MQQKVRSKSVNVYKRRDGRPKNAYYRSNLNTYSDLEGVPLVPPYHKLSNFTERETRGKWKTTNTREKR